MRNKIIGLLPIAVTSAFCCDYTDVYRPLIKYTNADFRFIDRYHNKRGQKFIDRLIKDYDCSERFKEPIDIKALTTYKTYKEIKSQVSKELLSKDIDILILTHGHTHESYHKELRTHNKFENFKKSERKFNLKRIGSINLDCFFAYIVLEVCSELSINVKNIWFDPLQLKFDYIENLKIENKYFHPTISSFSVNEIQPYTHFCKKNFSNTISFTESLLHLERFKELLDVERILRKRKKHESVFGFSIAFKSSKFRLSLLELIRSFDNSKDRDIMNIHYAYKTRLFEELNIPKESETDFLPYEEYVKKVSRAYTTLVLPSIDTSSFSLIRFIEALSEGTISLIYDNCKFDKGSDYDVELFSVYKKHKLFLSSSNVKKRDIEAARKEIFEKTHYVKSNYEIILRDIMNTKFIKKLSSNNTYIEDTNKLLN